MSDRLSDCCPSRLRTLLSRLSPPLNQYQRQNLAKTMNQSTRSKQTVSTALFGLTVFVAVMLQNDPCLAQSSRYRPPEQPTLADPPPSKQATAKPDATPKPAPSPQSSSATQQPSATPATVKQSAALGDLVNSQPVVLKAEAFAGQPYGVGKITFRLSSSDKLLDRTGAILIDDAERRLLYPVISTTAFKAFVENFIGRRANEPTDVHTVWFLFQGETPLTISVFGSEQAAITVPVGFVRPRQFDRRVKQWWQAFNRVVDEQIKSGDYPPILHAYLKNLIGKRFGLIAPSQQKKKDPLLETFKLMFDVESIRIDTINDLMTRGVQPQPANLPLPAPIKWTDIKVDDLTQKVEIEPMAQCVPEECFYLRFGTWGNQLWLKRLMEEYGGDLSRMIQARGFRYRIPSKFLDQLAIENTGFDDLFGGRLIDDVAVIGTDTYFDSGSAVGVILHAKDSKFLKNNLTNKRVAFAKRNKDIGVTIEEIKVGEDTIDFLSTPDNRYRSYYVVAKDCHLFTTSLTVAKRFLEASQGERNLATSDEFRFARHNMPLDREDTIFVFVSTRFFKNLLTPKYQIELRRRNRIATDMTLLELAKLAANNEGRGQMSIQAMVDAGYLPSGFGYRPDGGSFKIEGERWQDSIRGQRGFFIPIPDMTLAQVTQEETQWFNERATFFANSIKTLDPMVVALKRYELNDKGVERVVFDARLAPFGAEKYGWLMSMLGPPLQREVNLPPDDIASFQASMKGGNLNPHIQPHQIFAGVQDSINPNIDMTPTSRMGALRTLREIPGYLGSWPGLGYTNWMPALGGPPDQHGYTYSRLLKLWKLQWESFSVLSFDQPRLESLKPHLKIIDSDRPAQIRLSIDDLSESKLKDWANMANYRRAWQTSVSNVQMLNLAVQQFRISPEDASVVMQRMLDAELVCWLGGEYQLAKSPSGRSIWVSSEWPSFINPALPPDHIAPLLGWFRGIEVQVSKAETQFSIHGFLDIQRSEQTTELPSFDLFKGFNNLFGG